MKSSTSLERTADGLSWILEDGLRLDFTRLRQARGGVHSGVWSDLVVYVEKEQVWRPVHESRYNLSSITTRRDLSKFLCDRLKLPMGQDVADVLSRVDAACSAVCRSMRAGREPTCLAAKEDPGPVCYVLEKLVQDSQLNVMYGEKGSGKSQLALAVAYAVQDDISLLGLETKKKAVLYLDWETGEDEQTRRLHSMARGLASPYIPEVDYLEMDRPLADDVEWIKPRAEGRLVVIDSLVPACGGDAREEAATAFWHACRALHATIFCVAQTQKNDQPGKRKKTVFGSGLFEYAARSIWYVRGCQEADEPEMDIILSHEKNNNGPRFRPLSWHISFNGNATAFRLQDPRAVAEFAVVMPVKDRLTALLRPGARTVADISAELQISGENVRAQLSRHKEDFIRLDDKRWGLRERNVAQQGETRGAQYRNP